MKRYGLLVAAAITLGACDAGSREAEEAREFVLAKTAPTVAHGRAEGITTSQTWELVDPVLAPNAWSWAERQSVEIRYSPLAVSILGKDDSGTTRMVEVYNVDPAELVWPPKVTEFGTAFYVTFECKLRDCITVQVSQDQQERRTANSWHYSDAETAQRVANAMSVLLKAHGASEAAYHSAPAQSNGEN